MCAFMKNEANKLLVATTKKLLHHQGHPQLLKLIGNTHPADLAYVFNRLTRADRIEFFPLVSNVETAAELITELEPLVRVDFLQELPERQLVNLLEHMSSDDVADVLANIEDEHRREVILTMMQREELVTTQSLMEYDPQSAGGLMVPDFLALSEGMSAEQALRRIQDDAGNAEVVLYLYVVNEHHHLVGVTSLRELVLSPPDRTIKDFMIRQVIRVSVDTDQEEVARLIARYNLIALPVVDGNNQLIGIVTVDDIIDVIRSEATEDMMLMAGAGDQQVEDLHLGVVASVRSRSPWLVSAALIGVLGVVLLWMARELLLDKLAWWLLLPWLLSLSGSVATQSGAIVARGMALGRAAFSQPARVLRNEFTIGALSGILWALLAGACAWGVMSVTSLTPALPAWRFALLAALTMWLAQTFAAAFGAMLPLMFSSLGRDPALATGPLSTALVHTSTLMIWIAMALAL